MLSPTVVLRLCLNHCPLPRRANCEGTTMLTSCPNFGLFQPPASARGSNYRMSPPSMGLFYESGNRFRSVQ